MNKIVPSFTDKLSDEEVQSSIRAAEQLKSVSWAVKMFRDRKIKKALKIQPNPDIKYQELNEVKSALFEVRFAAAIHAENFYAEYEYKTGLGKTSVDFKLQNETYTWLIELTSLRESNAVHQNTSITNQGFIEFKSVTSKEVNAPEILDILKLQNAIYNKVIVNTDNTIIPIKFPEVIANTYHVVIVDTRSVIIGTADYYDYLIAVNGSQCLIDDADGFLCRCFFDQSSGTYSHIRGVFEEINTDIRSKAVKDRIHFICFINETQYRENEMLTEMFVFPNPIFFNSWQEAIKAYPFHSFKNLPKGVDSENGN